MPSVTYVVDFLTQTAVSHVVNSALTAGVNAVMVPTQILLAVGTAAATSIATFLIMTTAKMALAGTVYVGSKAVNGVTYFFYKPEEKEKQKSEEFDDCDAELRIVSNPKINFSQ